MTVLRRALLFAIPAYVATMVLASLWPFVKAAAVSGSIPRGIPIVFILSLAPPVTLILFLVALYQELTGHAGPSRRQVWAFAAGCGMAIPIGLRAWSLLAVNWLPPQIRAQFPRAIANLPDQWMHAIFKVFLPDVIFIGFLLVFWRDAAPLGRIWTRTLAFVLCLFTMPPVVNNSRGFVAGMHRYRAEWRGRFAALPGAQGQTQKKNTTLTLAVRQVTPCGSAHAGAPMHLSETAKSYCLMEPVIVDQQDIVAAEFDQQGHDQSTVQLTLNDDAARRSMHVTGERIGAQLGVVINGQLVSVATIQAALGEVWLARLAPNVANRVVEAFPRRPPVFPYWDRVTLFWDMVILPAVLLAGAAALPFFLFSVGWTGRAVETAR